MHMLYDFLVSVNMSNSLNISSIISDDFFYLIVISMASFIAKVL